MASTANSPRVEGNSENAEERSARDETRTRLFRPGTHARDTPVDAPARERFSAEDPVVDRNAETVPVVERRVEEDVVEERRVLTKRAHTSPSATFALIFGVIAAYTALLVFLNPADLVLGVVALVLGLIGMRAAGKVGVTGRWLAMLGALLGLGAVLLGTLTLAGVETDLNDKGAVDRLQQQVEQWRDRFNDSSLSDGITG